MPKKNKHDLARLRDQIVSTFDMEELKLLAFDLELDWDELKGLRKSARIQDLITQLGNQQRLEELVDSLKLLRPHMSWKAVSSEQTRAVRIAFPSEPYYKQAWFTSLSTTIILVGILTLLLFQLQVPKRIVDAFILPFPSEQSGETLIIISTFFRTEGVLDVGVHNEIQRAIQDKIDTLKLENVRVAVAPTILQSDDREGAEELGDRYNASIIIWGADTGIRQEINFLNLKGPGLFAAAATINETEKTQLAEPDAYARFIIKELPGQLIYLSFYALGQVEYIRSNYDHAIVLVKTAIEALPETSQINALELALDTAYYGLGFMYHITEQPVSAINFYSQAISLNPKFAEAFTNRGNVYEGLGEFDLAIADYDQALALSPEDAVAISAINNRGLVYMNQGKVEQAINEYDKAIALNSEDPDLFNNRGIAYTHLGKDELAIADFEHAVTLNPQDADSYYNRGLLYHNQGKINQAIADHNRAISLNSEHVDALIDRGNIYDELGEFEQALAD